MSTASWKNQGGFSKHRNVGSVTIRNQKDISTLNLSLYPYATLPPTGTTGLNPGTIIFSQNTIYYKDEAGDWEALAASGSTGLWHENGSDIYYNTGNVGIGTDTPDKSLTIKTGTDNDGIALKNENDKNLVLIQRSSQPEDAYIGMFDGLGGGSYRLLLHNNGNQSYINVPNQNFGLGTNTPGEKLDISGGNIRIKGVGASGSANGGSYGRYFVTDGYIKGVPVGGANDTYTYPIYCESAQFAPNAETLADMYGIGWAHKGSASFLPGTGQYGLYLAAAGDANIFLGASAGTDSYFNAGNVGIGCTGPDQRLVISECPSNAAVTLSLQRCIKSGGETILQQSYGESHIICKRTDAPGVDNPSFIIKMDNGATGSTGPHDRFFIDFSGNVGIGTPTFGMTGPISQLQVGPSGPMPTNSHQKIATQFAVYGPTGTTSSPLVQINNGDLLLWSDDMGETATGGHIHGFIDTPEYPTYSMGCVCAEGTNSHGYLDIYGRAVDPFVEGDRGIHLAGNGVTGAGGSLSYFNTGGCIAIGGTGSATGMGATGVNTLFVDGEIRATGDIISFWSSDNRLKTNLEKIEEPLEKLKQINGYTYDWIENPHIHSHLGRDVGVIAQELDAIGLTGIVKQRDNGYMAVNYDKIIPLLIECIKSQQEQLNKQQEQINALLEK